MDCNSARILLELVPSELPDHADPDFQTAVAHLEDCMSCAKYLEYRQEQDLIFSKLCRDVPIPDGLEARLLDALEQKLPAEEALSSLPEENTKTQTRSRRIFSRRSFVATASLSLLCLAVGFGYWAWKPAISLDEITDLAVQSIESDQFGPLFVGPFNPEQLFPEESLLTPDSFREDSYRRLPGVPQRCNAAISSFSFVDQRGRKVHGALLIVPIGQITDPPPAKYMSAASAEYRKLGYHAKSWRPGNGYVYICIVNGGEGPLEDLQRRSDPQRV